MKLKKTQIDYNINHLEKSTEMDAAQFRSFYSMMLKDGKKSTSIKGEKHARIIHETYIEILNNMFVNTKSRPKVLDSLIKNLAYTLTGLSVIGAGLTDDDKNFIHHAINNNRKYLIDMSNNIFSTRVDYVTFMDVRDSYYNSINITANHVKVWNGAEPINNKNNEFEISSVNVMGNFNWYELESDISYEDAIYGKYAPGYIKAPPGGKIYSLRDKLKCKVAMVVVTDVNRNIIFARSPHNTKPDIHALDEAVNFLFAGKYVDGFNYDIDSYTEDANLYLDSNLTYADIVCMADTTRLHATLNDIPDKNKLFTPLDKKLLDSIKIFDVKLNPKSKEDKDEIETASSLLSRIFNHDHDKVAHGNSSVGVINDDDLIKKAKTPGRELLVLALKSNMRQYIFDTKFKLYGLFTHYLSTINEFDLVYLLNNLPSNIYKQFYNKDVAESLFKNSTVIGNVNLYAFIIDYFLYVDADIDLTDDKYIPSVYKGKIILANKRNTTSVIKDNKYIVNITKDNRYKYDIYSIDENRVLLAITNAFQTTKLRIIDISKNDEGGGEVLCEKCSNYVRFVGYGDGVICYTNKDLFGEDNGKMVLYNLPLNKVIFSGYHVNITMIGSLFNIDKMTGNTIITKEGTSVIESDNNVVYNKGKQSFFTIDKAANGLPMIRQHYVHYKLDEDGNVDTGAFDKLEIPQDTDTIISNLPLHLNVYDVHPECIECVKFTGEHFYYLTQSTNVDNKERIVLLNNEYNHIFGTKIHGEGDVIGIGTLTGINKFHRIPFIKASKVKFSSEYKNNNATLYDYYNLKTKELIIANTDGNINEIEYNSRKTFYMFYLNTGLVRLFETKQSESLNTEFTKITDFGDDNTSFYVINIPTETYDSLHAGNIDDNIDVITKEITKAIINSKTPNRKYTKRVIATMDMESANIYDGETRKKLAQLEKNKIFDNNFDMMGRLKEVGSGALTLPKEFRVTPMKGELESNLKKGDLIDIENKVVICDGVEYGIVNEVGSGFRLILIRDSRYHLYDMVKKTILTPQDHPEGYEGIIPLSNSVLKLILNSKLNTYNICNMSGKHILSSSDNYNFVVKGPTVEVYKKFKSGNSLMFIYYTTSEQCVPQGEFNDSIMGGFTGAIRQLHDVCEGLDENIKISSGIKLNEINKSKADDFENFTTSAAAILNSFKNELFSKAIIAKHSHLKQFMNFNVLSRSGKLAIDNVELGADGSPSLRSVESSLDGSGSSQSQQDLDTTNQIAALMGFDGEGDTDIKWN